MSLHDTNRQRDTGGCDPFQIAASMESHNLQQGAEIIDSTPGQPGTVRVERRPGTFNPAEKLTDAVAVYGSKSPGVRVEVRHGRKP